MVVLNNEVFRKNFVEYLEYMGLNDISQIMKSCEFIITDTGQFSYKVWNQTQLELDIRVPLSLMENVDKYWEQIKKICYEIYPDDENHSLVKISKGIKFTHFELDENFNPESENTLYGDVFDNLISKAHKEHMDTIEKDYIIEACLCAKNGYRLAAATMIGCAAERLLIQLCSSYLKYLKNGNGSPKEIENFERDVVNAKKAHTMLEGFLRKVRNSEKTFEQIGLENSNLHFSFLDIVRQVRNESGHPTGIKVSAEDLTSIFVNYQLLIERVHPIIIKLPTLQK